MIVSYHTMISYMYMICIYSLLSTSLYYGLSYYDMILGCKMQGGFQGPVICHFCFPADNRGGQAYQPDHQHLEAEGLGKFYLRQISVSISQQLKNTQVAVFV